MPGPIRRKELQALIRLLDDPDSEILDVVTRKIIHSGIDTIPHLEQAWELSPSEALQRKLEQLIGAIQLNQTKESLSRWASSASQDLLVGAYLVARYQYPNLEFGPLESGVERLRRDIWAELVGAQSPLERVAAVNQVLFKVHRFTGNASNYFAPQNHFINQVLESRRGGPVALAILYLVLAQRMGIPIHGVSLPRNFILAYAEAANAGRILFYINPYNKGMVLGRREIELFLKQHRIDPKEEYFAPCSNRTTIAQLIGSLMIAYQKVNQPNRASELLGLLDIVSER